MRGVSDCCEKVSHYYDELSHYYEKLSHYYEKCSHYENFLIITIKCIVHAWRKLLLREVIIMRN